MMGLLEKFNNIEITADTRISDADRQFCQRQKKAYDHARAALKAMAEYSSRFLDEQREIEGEDYGTFLGEFKPGQYIDTLRDSHKKFIHRLFVYFRSSYNVTISEGDAEEVLLPKKPDSSGWGSDIQMQMAFGMMFTAVDSFLPIKPLRGKEKISALEKRNGRSFVIWKMVLKPSLKTKLH